jgi:hypothetical protein
MLSANPIQSRNLSFQKAANKEKILNKIKQLHVSALDIRILLLNGSLWCLKQCCGSGSALIWAVLDGAWKLKRFTKNMVFWLSYLQRYVF